MDNNTLHTLLNHYLQDYKVKTESAINDLERDQTNAKAVSKLRTELIEVKEYEHDVLYPMTTQNLQLDLDDGVLVNYLRFTPAVTKLPNLERNRKKVVKWEWPHNRLEAE
jgi:hypothetical protein